MIEPPFEQSEENVRQWRARATGAAEGFWTLGILPSAEFEGWVDRLRSAVIREPEAAATTIPAVPGPAVGGFEVGSGPHPPSVDPSVPPDATPFVRLIAAPDREFPYPGTHRLRVVALEQYEGGVAVLWLLRSIAAQSPETGASSSGVPGATGAVRRTRLPGFDLVDDLSTAYHPVRTTATGVDPIMHGRTLFSPGIPADAMRLEIRVDGTFLVIDLTTGLAAS